jgi:hypothetical protein
VLFGMPIAIGDSNTQTVTITGASLIKLAGPIQLSGIARCLSKIGWWHGCC